MEKTLTSGNWVIKLNSFSMQCLEAAGIDIIFDEVDPDWLIGKVSDCVKRACDNAKTLEQKKDADIALYALALSLVGHRKVAEFLAYTGYYRRINADQRTIL